MALCRGEGGGSGFEDRGERGKGRDGNLRRHRQM